MTPAPGAAGEGCTGPPGVLSPQLLGGGWGAALRCLGEEQPTLPGLSPHAFLRFWDLYHVLESLVNRLHTQTSQEDVNTPRGRGCGLCAERRLTWADGHPAAPLLLVHPGSPASGALLPGPGLAAVPEGLKELHLSRCKTWRLAATFSSVPTSSESLPSVGKMY